MFFQISDLILDMTVYKHKLLSCLFHILMSKLFCQIGSNDDSHGVSSSILQSKEVNNVMV
jgi:hypothetical protein